jgi:hypothetical protein
MCATSMRARVIGRAAIAPIFSGPWCVPVIVERQATTSPSQMTSCRSKRRSGKAVRSVEMTSLRCAVQSVPTGS